MSRDSDALQREARAARQEALAHLRRLPERGSRTGRAVVRRHPLLVAGGALALGVLGTARRRPRRREPRAPREPSPWPVLLGGAALRLLPFALQGSSGAAAAPPAPET